MTWLTRIKPRRKARRGPPRSKRYLAWIHTWACLVCGLVAVEAAHTGPHGSSQKSSDFSVIPLCVEHHQTGRHAIGKIGHVRFAEVYGLDLRAKILEYHVRFEQQGGKVEQHKDDWWRAAA